MAKAELKVGWMPSGFLLRVVYFAASAGLLHFGSCRPFFRAPLKIFRTFSFRKEYFFFFLSSRVSLGRLGSSSPSPKTGFLVLAGGLFNSCWRHRLLAFVRALGEGGGNIFIVFTFLFFLFLFRSWGTRIGKYVLVPSSRSSMLEISLRRMFFPDINNLLFFLRPEALVKSSSRSKRPWAECELASVFWLVSSSESYQISIPIICADLEAEQLSLFHLPHQIRLHIYRAQYLSFWEQPRVEQCILLWNQTFPKDGRVSPKLLSFP